MISRWLIFHLSAFRLLIVIKLGTVLLIILIFLSLETCLSRPAQQRYGNSGPFISSRQRAYNLFFMAKTYDWSEVQKHTGKEDCWLVIEKKVYDVSKYINEHPGGSLKLLGYAGRNATLSFKIVGHSDLAYDQLEGLCIGDLRE